MRLSDAGMRRHQAKLLYPNHRPSPCLTEAGARDRSSRLLGTKMRPSIANLHSGNNSTERMPTQREILLGRSARPSGEVSNEISNDHSTKPRVSFHTSESLRCSVGVPKPAVR